MTRESGQRIDVDDEDSIVAVRQMARSLAQKLGFGVVDQTRITTVASELARNIFRYAGTGHAVLTEMRRATGEAGIEIVFKDDGPGIEDVEKALVEGYTSGKGLGLGLPGSKKLMDDFEIETAPGEGTRVTVRKWC